MAASITMSVVMTDSSYETVTANVTHVNPALFPSSGNVAEGVYQAADTIGRKIAGLTSNSYVDTIINRTESASSHING